MQRFIWPFLAFSLFLIPENSMAQGMHNVVNAYSYLSDNDIVNAKKEIDKGLQSEKVANTAKAWYYKGLIYCQVATTKDEIDYDVSKEEAIVTAVNSFIKARSLDTKRIDAKDLDRRLSVSSDFAFQIAVNRFNEKNYQSAYECFMVCVNGKNALGIVDNLAIYNLALTAENMGETEVAISHYRQCIEQDYEALKCYQFIVYLLSENEVKVEEILIEALDKYPDDINLLTSYLNLLLK